MWNLVGKIHAEWKGRKGPPKKRKLLGKFIADCQHAGRL
jgi:hypothetical protein